MLKRILEKKRRRLKENKSRLPIRELKKKIPLMDPPRDFFGAIRNPRMINLIAEAKRSSPSRGLIRPHYNVSDIALSYRKGGAAAISVLTEEFFFSGDILHILEAFRKGADGVLIAACAEEDCKQEKASGKAQHSVETLIQRLAQIGLQDRLHFCTVAPRHPDKFDEELEQFSKKIGAIGSKKS